MNRIPTRYLKDMSTYSNIKVHGETVTVIVDTGDSSTLTEDFIRDFKSHSERNSVVGVDFKRIAVECGSTRRKNMLVLFASNRCLIFRLEDGCEVPISLYNLLSDSNICFIGHPRLFSRDCLSIWYTHKNNSHCDVDWNALVVSAGELVARVLKKPGLTTSGFVNIAREVGVQYGGPSSGTGSFIYVDSRNSMVLTENMVKDTINDAAAHYLIGCKLFNTTIKVE